MARNVDLVDYSRQRELDSRLVGIKDTTHFILGCGGIGYWLGIQLAMLGASNFVLVDGDKLEASNLNRLPVPQTWIGHNKALALSNMIHFLRPLCTVTVIQQHASVENIGLFLGVAGDLASRLHHSLNTWDCTDNARIQKVIYKAAKDVSYYTKLGYEGMEVGCYNNFNIWIDEATYQPGYRTSNANAVTSSIAAGLGIFYRGLGLAQDNNINLETLVRGNYVQRE